MDISISFLLLLQILVSSSNAFDDNVLRQGSSLSVEKSSDRLISANGVYSAGFFSVGQNTFSFAVWFTNSKRPTAAWMANRDLPVNGKGSKLSLLRNGDLSLTDSGGIQIWNSKTFSDSPVQLLLSDIGSLDLLTLENEPRSLWKSFDSPTDTLLPHQRLTRGMQLVSYRGHGNYSSGFYRLYFDNDNVLRLLYTGPQLSSIYWPDPIINVFDLGRTTYNNTLIAVFSDSGYFQSSDNYNFKPSDFGMGPQRRLTLDFDGNLRMYSLEEATGEWDVSWQLEAQPCKIHGLCGPNSLCSYVPKSSRVCSCLPGFKIINSTDWSYGCEIESEITCNHTEVAFQKLSHVDFYGYDMPVYYNATFTECERRCLKSCDCHGFMFKYQLRGVYDCYLKYLLLNGYRSPNFSGIMYVKMAAKAGKFSNSGCSQRLSTMECPQEVDIELNRKYNKAKENESLRLLLWFATGVGCVEVTCIFLIWGFLYRTNPREPDTTAQGYIIAAATGFKKFSYSELKKATLGFSKEIGRGAGGIVYKGTLPDGRVAAIKRLGEAKQAGEAEFLAEASTIGKLNHMNLIEMWGYCAEEQHRLLVYEYMEHGSLAENLCSNNAALKWEQRFEIAVGTARGLAYLHEECLEWILHCDIKPQNILLDSDYRPKVADFGLSKLLNRSGLNNSSFSKIRGTRGYMAPEWIYNNIPITSKVDVYSYGIVVLEMITGKSAVGELVTWVKEEKMFNGGSWIEEIADPSLGCEYDRDKMEVLVGVALQCVEEDRNARPTMRQVVEMILLDNFPDDPPQ